MGSWGSLSLSLFPLSLSLAITASPAIAFRFLEPRGQLGFTRSLAHSLALSLSQSGPPRPSLPLLQPSLADPSQAECQPPPNPPKGHICSSFVDPYASVLVKDLPDHALLLIVLSLGLQGGVVVVVW